ncbi:MAG: porin family protein [Bacteroidia bacterium]
MQLVIQPFILAMALIKKSIVLFIFIVVSDTLLAQQIKESKFGIMGGVGYNTQVQAANKIAPVSYGYNNTFTPYLGLVYRDSITKWLTFKSSLYYVQRGVRYNYSFDSPTYYLHVKQTFTCHYVSFPIKLNFNIKRFFIGIGVEGSILIKGHYDFNAAFGNPSTGYAYTDPGMHKWATSNLYQPVDAGYTFSLGYRFKHFEIELNMFHGLIVPPNFKPFCFEHFDFQYLYQQTFMLGINYFPVFKKHLHKNTPI